MEVFIPEELWGEDVDPRLLYDCVDHELVHAEDFASGRAYRYESTYGEEITNIIMEYKAYYKNLQNDCKRSSPLDSYTPIVNELKKKLPKDWKKQNNQRS